MMGMHGEAWVNSAIQQADLLLAGLLLLAFPQSATLGPGLERSGRAADAALESPPAA